jgi:uncharacterized protein (DUF1778 family)
VPEPLAKPSATTRDENINLRISAHQRALIDRAAHALGRTRSDFMLDASSRAATAVLLDQRVFMLDPAAFKRFVAALDKPPTENPRLRRLLAAKAPWER